MILVIDNFDSFTWNLVAQVKKTGVGVQVCRNNEVLVSDVELLQPSGIIFSPGPGRPSSAGVCPEVLDVFAGRIPILGICLGHQMIGEKLGLRLVQSHPPVHGKTAEIIHDEKELFKGVSQGTRAMRYHSLVLEMFTPDAGIELTAQTNSGVVMGVRNKFLKLEGLQFHPESILTPEGDKMMENWLMGIQR